MAKDAIILSIGQQPLKSNGRKYYWFHVLSTIDFISKKLQKNNFCLIIFLHQIKKTILLSKTCLAFHQPSQVSFLAKVAMDVSRLLYSKLCQVINNIQPEYVLFVVYFVEIPA